MTVPPPSDTRAAAEPDPQAEAAAWWVRRQDGLQGAEEAELQAWLVYDPAHGAALDRVGRVWTRLDTLPVGDVKALTARLDSAP